MDFEIERWDYDVSISAKFTKHDGIWPIHGAHLCYCGDHALKTLLFKHAFKCQIDWIFIGTQTLDCCFLFIFLFICFFTYYVSINPLSRVVLDPWRFQSAFIIIFTAIFGLYPN